MTYSSSGHGSLAIWWKKNVKHDIVLKQFFFLKEGIKSVNFQVSN